MNIKELIKQAHENAVDKGFYYSDGGYCLECKKYNKCISEYKSESGSCDLWVDPNKNIGELLMLIVSELSEALEAHRKGKFADWENYEEYSKDSFCIDSTFACHIKDTFEDELADVFIRLFSLCGYLDIILRMGDSYNKIIVHENVGHMLFCITKLITDHSGQIENDQGLRSLEIQLNSVYLALLRFCKHHNIDIEKHIQAKMKYNKTRPYKHNKEY